MYIITAYNLNGNIAGTYKVHTIKEAKYDTTTWPDNIGHAVYRKATILDRLKQVFTTLLSRFFPG